MNAHKFVAEKGIDEAKRVLELASDAWAYDAEEDCFFDGSDLQDGYSIEHCNGCFLVEKLKQVVESLDTIDRLFGLHQAKHTMLIAKEIGYSSDYEQIKQAIADYELVESFKYGALTNKGTKCEVLDMVDVSPRCEVRNEI